MLKDKWDNRPERYPYTHRHSFSDVESLSQSDKQSWLDERLQRLADLGLQPIEALIEETPSGYEFHLGSNTEYGFFMLAMFGEMEGHRNHSQSYEFSDGQIDPEWIKAAETYLKACGIEYDIEYSGNSAYFKFDRFSESYLFKELIEGGQIDRLAQNGMDEEFHAQVDCYNNYLKDYIRNNFAHSPS